MKYCSPVDLIYNFKKSPNLISTRDMADRFAEHLAKGEPFFAGRIGMSETNVLRMAVFGYEERFGTALEQLQRWSGFFYGEEQFVPGKKDPLYGELVERYFALNREALGLVDYLHPMEGRGENYLIHKYCREDVVFIDNPGCWEDPDTWSRHLAGKKVLVVHPFTDTIEKQYARHDKLFPTIPDMLPDFELKTVKAVQTIAGERDSRFKDWFEALQYMCDAVDKESYDIALVGCGAYGFPLAAHIKKSGRSVIHMGGDLQMLFGIMGSRWDDHPGIRELTNEYWVRPAQHEVPGGSSKVEGGCYW